MNKISKLTRHWVVLATLAVSLIAWGSATQKQDEGLVHLQPSHSGAPFHPEKYQSFADYLTQTRQQLESEKVFMNPQNREQELAAAMPFELTPRPTCPTGTDSLSRGILLIHGLSDTPLVMRDLAEAFSERCFLVRVILLPGHGVRAGDLLNVTRQDWLNATQFVLQTLKNEVDEVYIAGYSLGGLLAVHTATSDPEIKAVLGFSPALALKKRWLLQQTVWLRYFMDWADTDPQDDYARFEAVPLNALAETYLLTQDLLGIIDDSPLEIPVFMAQDTQDVVIDTASNRYNYLSRFKHPGSQLIEYQPSPSQKTDPTDDRVFYMNSFLPDQRIASFSHQAVHISPDNPHYGVNGDYRSCGENGGRNLEAVRRCLEAPNPWRGNIYGDELEALEHREGLARLTYNPHFEDLLSRIDHFISDNDGIQTSH